MLKFEGLEVSVDYQMDETVYSGSTMAYAEFLVNDKPKEIPVHIEVEKQEGVYSYSIFQTKAREVKDEYVLYVPVEYKGNAPSTRIKGKDNVDIILVSSTCKFKDLQVSVTTRNGLFFLNVQKIWSGTVAVPEEQATGEVECDFVPDEPVFNYPGSNYQNIWRGMAEEILKVIKELDLPLPKVADVRAPRWMPAQARDKVGLQKGTVTYFNMVTGTGQIIDRYSETYFVHFTSVTFHTGGQQRLLTPGAGVYFKTQVEGQRIQVKSVLAA